jgi:hypothetical protein
LLLSLSAEMLLATHSGLACSLMSLST